MKWSNAAPLAAGGALLGVLCAAGCDQKPRGCTPPETDWACSLNVTPNPYCTEQCGTSTYPGEQRSTCAADAVQAGQRLVEQFAAQGYAAVVRTCWKLGPHLLISPGFDVQGGETCITGAADDACVSCAKANCCDDYTACFADQNCACLVSCIDSGTSVDACSAPDACGAPTAISVSTAACLNASCAACTGGSAPSTGELCACPTQGSTSSSSGGPSCTPGPTGSGQPCFSDGDCASCGCDPQTMTCD
jgi:hypothetical protein